jgi:hypothetical protein
MDIINTLFSDDSPACRGCQVTSLRIEGSDELASDKNQRHLKNGSVFAYADQWCIAVNVSWAGYPCTN